MVGLNDLKGNLGIISAGAGGLALGTGIGLASGIALGKKKRKSSRRSKRSYRKVSRSRKRKTPYTAGKRKDRSRKRIRYTKTGQPYVIMASGKARFIKKKGARLARKRKGGRY